MWEPYINSVKEHLSSAEDKIVFDRFHIMKHMGEAVDTVRKGEHRELRAEGIDTLTGFEVPLALRREEPARQAQEHVPRSSKALNLRTSPRLGHQGVAVGSVELPPTRLGAQVLQAVVLLGDTFAPDSRSSTSPT